ncbi:hypothetical protein BDV32DRAFT_142068 [Aspergillus pseudonomiae]|nr:hypothetical protein BDV32DRAFT_142068 [Aspergillus pseudonomiae]
MNYPILILYSEGVRRPMVAFGSSGIICRDFSIMLKCSESTVIFIKEENLFFLVYIEREKSIYQYLFKYKNILEYLDITETGISSRNFLIIDDLLIKFCDFTNSDLFVLGYFIFEILASSRPYEKIGDKDSEIIAGNYGRGIFLRVEDLKYRDIIYKCWTS